MSKILITGTAGFIGFHLVNRIVKENFEVVGLDCINDYYEINLKYDRLKTAGINSENLEYNKLVKSSKHNNYSFIKLDLADRENLERLFKEQKFDYVVNLAAQAGVRYSLINPYAYIESNIIGFTNILENCRHNEIKHLVYASSSSVYGANTTQPFSVHHNIDHPISLYAASKKSNELMAHTYSALYNLPTTGLRFFTVYGPWGRPDMALFIFTKAILENKGIDVYNFGKMKRDFTYIDDIIEGVYRLVLKTAEPNNNWSSAKPDPGSSFAPYLIFNIGNNQPVELLTFIETLEEKIGKTANKNLMEIQPGDVPETYADVEDLMNWVGFKPATTIDTGIENFVNWYKNYYNIH